MKGRYTVSNPLLAVVKKLGFPKNLFLGMVSAAGYKSGTQVTPKLLFTSFNVGTSGKALMFTAASIGAAIDKDHAPPRAGADPPNHFKLLEKTGRPAAWLWRDDMPNLQAIVTRGAQLNAFITDCCKTADYQTALSCSL